MPNIRKHFTCTQDDCDKVHFAKGLCSTHYSRGYNKPEYKAWIGMKSRCNNPSDKGYANYGGRGIKVADEWQHDFKTFQIYVGDKPSSKHSLDRINVNGNYEPGNVRWATWHVQNANQRKNNEVVGVAYFKETNKWSARLMVNRVEVFHKRFKTFQEAVSARKLAEERFLNGVITTL